MFRLSGDYKLAFPPFSSGCSPQSAMAYFKSGYGVGIIIIIIVIVIVITIVIVIVNAIVIVIDILVAGEWAPPANDNDGCSEPAPLNGLPH